MKPLTVTQLRSSNVDFNDFYKTLQLYGDIIKVYEIDVVTHEKHYLYRGNYFSVGMNRGEVVTVGTTYKNEPNFLKHLPYVRC